MTQIDKRTATAYHEAGHAVAFVLTSECFISVTIQPTSEVSGTVTPFPFLIRKGSPGSIVNRSIIDLAGMEAESILTGEWNVVSGKDDIEHLNEGVVTRN